MPLMLLRSAVARADALGDRAREKLRRLRAQRRPLLIEPYAGYGSAEQVHVGARVLADPGFTVPDAGHSAWQNIAELMRRLESDEVPGARVRVTFQGETQEVLADEEGHLRLTLVPPHPDLMQTTGRVDFELLDPPPLSGTAPVAHAPIHVPSQHARFGVISDIDDTVLQSHVTSRWRMLATLARGNAHSRKPFAGVAALYRALQAGIGGPGGDEGNPLFYVSSSPWNLHAMLTEFLRVQGLPPGPLMLKDFGDHTLFGASDHGSHKLARIEEVFATYPALPFVLIGDSGEQDPEIYAEVVHRHPGRVRAVYIRSVDSSPARLAAVDALVAQVRDSGAQLVLAPDSEYAAVHAAGEGLIAPQALAAVRADKQGDLAMPAA